MIGLFGIGIFLNFIFSLVVFFGFFVYEGKLIMLYFLFVFFESFGCRDDDGLYFELFILFFEKVECCMGEEGEEVLFCECCKLFRYDGEILEWKE